MMFASGMGIPHEYFNEIFFPDLAARFGVSLVGPSVDQPTAFWTKYMQALLAHRTRFGVFSAKIQYKQFNLFLKNSIGEELFENAFVIYLTRKDILAQAVSWHFAEITGQWDFDQAIITRPHKTKNFFDTEAIDFYLREIMAEHRLWEHFFSQKNIVPLRINSMELSRDPTKILKAIADDIGVPHTQLRAGFAAETRYDVDPQYPSKRAIMEFWLREKRVEIAKLRRASAPVHASSA